MNDIYFMNFKQGLSVGYSLLLKKNKLKLNDNWFLNLIGSKEYEFYTSKLD